jgi:hypothetical protein
MFHVIFRNLKNRRAVKNAVFCGVNAVLRFLVTANVVPSSAILFTLMIEVIHSFRTSVRTRATRRYIPQNGILIYTAVKTSNLTIHVLVQHNRPVNLIVYWGMNIQNSDITSAPLSMMYNIISLQTLPS